MYIYLSIAPARGHRSSLKHLAAKGQEIQHVLQQGGMGSTHVTDLGHRSNNQVSSPVRTSDDRLPGLVSFTNVFLQFA